MQLIHKMSNIEGEVDLGDQVSVWAFASIRGDEGVIEIGDNSNVQDNVVIHGNITIGENVTIGHGAVVHGRKIGNNVLIGMNSTILHGVEIEDWCIIAAGALVPKNMKVPKGSVIKGVPGEIVRTVTDQDKELIISSYKVYVEKVLQAAGK
jgi:carbonic anhydrase/acetyltransferase-like protein (isoleucine patch superfamily)